MGAVRRGETVYEHAIVVLAAAVRRHDHEARDAERDAEHGPWDERLFKAQRAGVYRAQLTDCMEAMSVLEALKQGRESRRDGGG